MTVYKTYFKLLKKLLPSLIAFLIITALFTILNASSNKTKETYIPVKPTIAIVNKDGDSKVIKSFIKYLSARTKLSEFDKEPLDVADSIFFAEYSEVVYIDKGFSKSFEDNAIQKININNNGDYGSTMINIWIENYLNKANIFMNAGLNSDETIAALDKTFKSRADIKIESTFDSDKVTSLNIYYNILNYTFVANTIYFIAMIMIKFNEEKRLKRQIASGTPYSKIVRRLYLCNVGFTIALWAVFIALSIVLMGSMAYSSLALWMMLNSFVFIISCMSLAFLITSFVTDDNAIAMAQNLIGLGTSFLCGAFVPAQFLPKWVLSISRIFPSYWYINNNDYIAGIDKFKASDYNYIFQNMAIVIIFSVCLYIASQIVNNKRLSKNA